MEPQSLLTEIILTHPHRSIGSLCLDWTPQPGSYLEVEGQTYAVLERRHRYRLKAGRYLLHKVALYVQSASALQEKSWFAGRWVIGDTNCRFSAYSELIRCAVNPQGPCHQCRFFESRS